MIKGEIKPTWKPADYHNVAWNKRNPNNDNYTFDGNVGHEISNDVGSVFEQVAQGFTLDNTVVALNKMPVGQILPWHIDRYATYIERNKIERKKDIVRIIVFLEDSMPGHQLWIEDEFCYGKAGSYFGWNYDTKHMAANLGQTDQYTLQITGVKK